MGRFGIDEIWAEIDDKSEPEQDDRFGALLMFLGYVAVVVAIIFCDILILSR